MGAGGTRGSGRSRVPDRNALLAHKHREACFLDAWKRGIRCVGVQYFEIDGAHYLELAMHRDQLRPNHRAISSALAGDRATGQVGLFLCALYSIYNDDEGSRLTRRYFPQCRSREQLLDMFDAERRDILETLVSNYTDW